MAIATWSAEIRPVRSGSHEAGGKAHRQRSNEQFLASKRSWLRVHD